jgi:hypothetical protein
LTGWLGGVEFACDSGIYLDTSPESGFPGFGLFCCAAGYVIAGSPSNALIFSNCATSSWPIDETSL